jgi:ATP-dependent RNA helicase HelY
MSRMDTNPGSAGGLGLSPPDPRALVDQFAGGYRFQLDEFQRRGCLALAAGQGALVAAPTGAGKTVVGEFAVWLALRSGGKAFYTTPLKALSNQKFGDFVARHGAAKVGLLTGDNSINGEAPVGAATSAPWPEARARQPRRWKSSSSKR